MPPELAAVHTPVWTAYERLNQRVQAGADAAAAKRSAGEEEGRDWRAYALAVTERLDVVKARLHQQLEQTTESHVAAHKPPPRPADDRQARR